MAFAILRTSKLKTMGNIGGSLAHNYRTIETPNADHLKTPDNFHSLSNPEAVKNAISERLPEKRRSDAVICIEYMVTASPEWDGWNDERQNEYFKQAQEWLEQLHGKQNVVATSIHKDETTPHLVAYVVPLDLDTGRLNAKKFLGGKAKLAQMQSDFADKMKNLGLERGIEGSKAKHTRIKEYYAKVNEPIPQIEKVERPKAGLFETTAQYGDKVVLSVLEQIKPKWESIASLSNEVKTARKEALEARRTLSNLQNEVKPYLDAIRSLNVKQKRELHDVMKDTVKTFEKSNLEAEKRIKERQERLEIQQWDDVYNNLTEDQKVKTEAMLMMFEEHFKSDPAMLKQKISVLKDKIKANPSVLDKVEMPSIKQQTSQEPVAAAKPKDQSKER